MAPSPKPKPRSAIAQHRQRLWDRGPQRVEVQVFGEDAGLLRAVAAALIDPGQAAGARVLQTRFSPTPTRSLKKLLAAAPFDGIEFDRDGDIGRPVDL